MINSLIQSWLWLIDHPAEVAMGIMSIWALSAVIGAVLWWLLCLNEERKYEREREDFRQRQRLAVAHRLPRPMHEKAPQGFDRRVS